MPDSWGKGLYPVRKASEVAVAVLCLLSLSVQDKDWYAGENTVEDCQIMHFMM